MAEAVDKAHTVCCFLTEKYENSANCKLELECAQRNGKRIIVCMGVDRKIWKPTNGKWLELIVGSINTFDFSDGSEEAILQRTHELIAKLKNEKHESKEKPLTIKDKLLIRIKQKYLRDSQLTRTFNETEKLPIEESYINLSILTTKEQERKEKRLNETQKDSSVIHGVYEEIYGTKSTIKVEELFKESNDDIKKLLILGRAGIGKTTFCHYVTYRWAEGELWSEYDLVALIRLRRLDKKRYPGNKYYRNDVLAGELFPGEELSVEESKTLKDMCKEKRILWLLDGYDELVQNVPAQLQDALTDIITNHNHILTSRPYAIDIFYKQKLEIIGFTDDDIPRYIDSFFKKSIMDDSVRKNSVSSLIHYMESHPCIWGVAHIPINLELLTYGWLKNRWNENHIATITTLYQEFVITLCRNYLKRKDPEADKKRNVWIEKSCQRELDFLSHLAYTAISSHEIIISPELFEKTEKTINYNLDETDDILKIGILKAYEETDHQTHRDLEKSYYFVHLSFQEFFAARDLVRRFKEDRQSCNDFIDTKKYDAKCSCVFVYATGLLAMQENSTSLIDFINTVNGKPKDIIGSRHIQLFMQLYDETYRFRQESYFRRLLDRICSWLAFVIRQKSWYFRNSFIKIIRTTDRLSRNQTLLNVFIEAIQHSDADVRRNACYALKTIGVAAATPNIIESLISTLQDSDYSVRSSACEALCALGEKSAVTNFDENIRSIISEELPTTDEKLANVEKALFSNSADTLIEALHNSESNVRIAACEALIALDEKAVDENIIKGLIDVMVDKEENVRNAAYQALSAIGEKAVTDNSTRTLVKAASCFIRDDKSAALAEFPFHAWSTSDVAKISLSNWIQNEQMHVLDVFVLFSLFGNVSVVIDRNVIRIYDTRKAITLVEVSADQQQQLARHVQDILTRLNVPVEQQASTILDENIGLSAAGVGKEVPKICSIL